MSLFSASGYSRYLIVFGRHPKRRGLGLRGDSDVSKTPRMVDTSRLLYLVLPSDLLVRVIARLYELFGRLELATTSKRRPSAFAELRRQRMYVGLTEQPLQTLISNATDSFDSKDQAKNHRTYACDIEHSELRGTLSLMLLL